MLYFQQVFKGVTALLAMQVAGAPFGGPKGPGKGPGGPGDGG